MVKFIACDLDGTLLLNGAQSVDESAIQYIDRLVESGVIFAPASGRQITSLKRLFEPISNKLAYIAENGALVEYRGETIGKTPMDRKLALEIIEDVIAQPNCEVLVSGEHTAYIKPKSEEYHYRMTKVVNYHTTLVDKFTDIDEDILKIAVCDMSGIKNSKGHFINKWSDRASVLVSGELYLDFMDSAVNKGRGIEQIQKYFGLKPEECMAFGDNYNDIAMLDKVYYSYVMEKAASDVKKHGRFITGWVEGTLREQFKDIV
ncbi:MAG: HAD family hydrolase [Lachnospira sp.]|nr:HAD family hydrolase [Lachnospira sp.]